MAQKADRPSRIGYLQIGRRGRLILGVVVLLGAIRASMPLVLERLINRRLELIPEYTGRVGDVSLSLFRGGYAIDDIAIFKANRGLAEPFFSARHIDFSLAWRDLFRGKVVSDIVVKNGQITLVRDEGEERTQVPVDRRWRDVVEDLFPIEITHLEIEDGDLRFIDGRGEPRVDIAVHHLQLLATGLRNRQREGAQEMPATIRAQGSTIGGGQLTLDLSAEPLAPQPHFALALKVEDVSLPALNDFLRAYANVDVSAGRFQLYIEAAGRDGGYTGYVKPFFQDLDFKNLADKERSLPGRIWESIVNLTNTIVKNRDRNQLGTRVPFSGDFEETEIGTWTAVVNTIRNGFVEALPESIEGTILPQGNSPERKG